MKTEFRDRTNGVRVGERWGRIEIRDQRSEVSN
jgi:hypothetical protein